MDDYQETGGLFCSNTSGKLGVAWPSSARVVRCWVKSRNERNPYPYLPASYVGNYKETANDVSWRKAGMMSGQHGPYGLGYTRATMVITTSIAIGRPGANLLKIILVRIAL
jgi:hypothetical protein